MPSLSRSRKHQAAAIPDDDLVVLDNGLEMVHQKDELDHLWFELVEREAGEEYHLFKVVRLAIPGCNINSWVITTV